MESDIFSERHIIAADQNIKEREYWLNRFSPPPVKIVFPYDRQPSAAGNRKFDTLTFTFQGELFDSLVRISKNSDVRLHILLAAGIVLLLNKYTGSTDITIGTPIYRQDIAGEFINTVLILRNLLREEETAKELLLQVGQTLREAAENQNFPVDVLPERLHIPFSPQEDFPLFDVSLLLQNIQEEEHIRHIRGNILFSFKRQENLLTGQLSYNTLLYDRHTAETIVSRLECLLANLLSGLDTPISHIEMISEAETRQILEEFNSPAVDFPGEKTVHRLFEEQAERTPNNIAATAVLDLSGLFSELESETLNPGLLPRLAGCCFVKNPHLCRGNPPFNGQKSGIIIIKTPHHNSVVISTAAAALLDMFDGERNLAAMFSCLEGNQTDLWLYAVAADDLLEITAELHIKPLRFSLATFADFIHLVKVFYRNFLIRLEGIAARFPTAAGVHSSQEPNLNRSSAGITASDQGLDNIKPTGPRLEEGVTLYDLLGNNATLPHARVLLLGDTPGIAGTGLLYLASYLRRKGISACCRFSDTSRDYQAMKRDIESLLQQVNPAVVAVSMKWFLYIERVLDTCRIIKDYARKHDLSVKVVVGGNTASFYAEEVFRNDFVDYLVCGDGELPLLKICQGEKPGSIPNILYRENGRVMRNSLDYVQDETTSRDIYLSHLDEILLGKEGAMFGTFFVYTHKGCQMQCFYCGGCRGAQERTFNRTKVLMRPVEDVRKDLMEARKYTLTFQFDFDAPNEDLLEYCRQLFDSIDLSSFFCIYSNLKPPSPPLMELFNSTFKYVYCDIDVLTLSEKHRARLASAGMVKPQPTDEEILAFFDECEKYDNVEVRVNLITGLPYFTEEDITASEKLLSHIMKTYSCFSELHWARLHAQPGAPILENPESHGMHSFATSYGDFLKYSKMNFNKEDPYPRVEYFNYPYIYYNEEPLNSSVTRFYTRSNQKIREFKKSKRTNLMRGEKLTYRQLDEAAVRLANQLRAKGVAPGAIVGLLVTRSLDIPLGILGILKAGCAYMPIDPEFPIGRIGYMLRDSRAAALVTTRSLFEEVEKLRSIEVETIFIEEIGSTQEAAGSMEKQGRGESMYSPDISDKERRGEPCVRPSITSQPLNSSENLAYVIYTSGTTGKPKGVLLKHNNLVNYAHWFKTAAHLTEADKTVLTSSYAFDLGYTSIYPSLLNGCELHILAREIYLSADNLLDYIKNREITYLKMTPSHFSVLVNHDDFSQNTCKSLRLVAVGGEPINVSDIKKAHSLCGHLQIMNHYGPTEATIGCVAALIDFEHFDKYQQNPFIGRPIHNTGVYIRGKNPGLLPVGVPGELCIAGTCLARGYLNRPEFTTERFVNYKLQITNTKQITNNKLQSTNSRFQITNKHDKDDDFTIKVIENREVAESRAKIPSHHSSFITHHSALLYKTGDLARWLPDGNIEFLGRIDTQVKVRGYRIELGEIESRLLDHHKVGKACVLVKETAASGKDEDKVKGDKTICAYIVPKEAGSERNKTGSEEGAAEWVSESEGIAHIRSFLNSFDEMVKENPDRIAVKSAKKDLAYASLDRYAHQAARQILKYYDDKYSLSQRERERYKRQMQLYGWGLESQERLKGTTVFVAGAGGGGSPTIMQLALLGFGTIKICDFDEIELSNLNRQFLHDEERLGMNKALSAKITVNRTNPHVKVIPYTERLTAENVFELVGDSELIFDMLDGPADKFILSECAVVRRIPHVIISMTDLNAYCTVLHTPHTPCYHCIFDKKKLETIVSGMKGYVEDYSKNPLAVASPSLFVSTGTAINEALKILLGFDRIAYNKFFYFNQRGATENLRYTPSFQSMTHLFSDFFRKVCKEQGFNWDVGWRGNFLEVLDMKPDPDCPVCGPKGREKREGLEERRRRAKQTAIPLEIEQELEREKSEKKGTVVLLVDGSKEAAVSIVGALKAGKTVVPCDPAAAQDRLADMLEDSEARVILTDNVYLNLANRLREKVNKNINVIDVSRIEIEEQQGAAAEPENLNIEKAGERPVFMFYPRESAAGRSGDFNDALRLLVRALIDGSGVVSLEYGQNADNSTDLDAELRDHLAGELPDYMIPTHFIQVEKIPLTPNGKVDHRSLPEPETISGKRIIAPRNQLESRLVEIWCDILGIEKANLSTDANFFQVGGHSLKATELVGRLHKELNVRITLAEIFERPRLDQLAEHIGALAVSPFEAVAPAPAQQYYILSSAQKRLFVLQQLTPESTGYNLPQFFPLPGGYSKDNLEHTFRQVIRRHESLRTRFVVVNEEPLQEILQPEDIEFSGTYYEIPAGKVDEREKILGHFIRPFDLSTAPLLRAAVVKEGEKSILLVDMHHIISDAVSHRILVRDFTALYQGEELPPLKVQYKDYALWQRRQFEENPAYKEQETYWVQQFAEEDLPVLDLPYDYVRPAVQSFTGHMIPFELDSEGSSALKRAALQNGLTLYMMLLAIFNLWVSRLSSQEDVAVGTPVAGRKHEDFRQIIGIFLNTLVMRNFPRGHSTFTTFLEEIKQRTIAAFENQDYPFEELVNRISLPRDTGRNPLFDVMFSYLDMNMPSEERTANPFAREGEEYRGFTNPVSKFDLTLYSVDMGDTIAFGMEYCTHLFKEETIRRFISYFKQIIASVLKEPHQVLQDIEVIPPAEKELLVYGFNQTDAPYPADKTLHRLFEDQAARSPDNTAVIGTSHRARDREQNGNTSSLESAYLTYRQLDEISGQLARLLRRKGVKPDTIAAVLVKRSLEMITGIFAVLKAGGAYLPIDPAYPQERKAYILRDSGAEVLLTSRDVAEEVEKLRSLEVETIFIEEIGSREKQCRGESMYSPEKAQSAKREAQSESYQEIRSVPCAVRSASSPGNLAYVIYTSGSTGLPKGVMIRHFSAVNRLHWMQRAYPIGCHDTILQKTPYTFDVSVWELFWWSFQGASLCLLEAGGEKDPGAIITAVEKYRVTTMHFVPSMLDAFLGYMEEEHINEGRLASLKQVFASGEALDVSQVERFNRLIGKGSGTRLINLYGPTEAAVDVSFFNCTPTPGLSRIPIGKPIDNIRLYIVSKYHQLQPIGVAGELCIAGEGLARGYLNNADLTAEKFISSKRIAQRARRKAQNIEQKVPGPVHAAPVGENLVFARDPHHSSFITHHSALLYKTGDLARWRPDGNIDFLGRSDHQVKIRGFRIEPGEIESCLLTHESIDKVVVIAVAGDRGSDKSLCAYVVSRQELNAAELREYLSGKLPDYMIPAHFVQLETISLTPSGKVNRSLLPAPGSSTRTGVEYVPPQNEVEEKLLETWQQVLGIPSIGVNDDFFTLGGDSLKAISLFSRIKKTFPDSQIILMDLFRHATIKKLARHLESGKVSEFNILQPLTPEADKEISLVCIPYAGGTTATFIKLAREISNAHAGIAIYTIALPGNDIGAPRPRKQSIKELARDCVAEIKNRISTPIVLYGHCVGAALTVEIARLLEEEKMALESVCLGGALFILELLEGDSDLWSGRSNEEIRDLMVEWGAFEKGEILRKDLIFFIGNFRKDVRLAVDYYKDSYKQGIKKRIDAPIYSIFSKKDPLTQRNYRFGYRRWKKFSKKVELIVIEEGFHYFINDNTSVVAAVVLDVISGKPSFRKIKGAKKKGRII